MCEEFYVGIYYLHKNSGKLKSSVQSACKTLGISNYKNLPKIHGTRFINHRRKGMRVLLDTWPGLIIAYENAITVRSGTAATKAKISGFLKKLKSYTFFCKTAYFLDILDASVPVSLVFEGNGLMPYHFLLGF